jgi:hypothetical protein
MEIVGQLFSSRLLMVRQPSPARRTPCLCSLMSFRHYVAFLSSRHPTVLLVVATRVATRVATWVATLKVRESGELAFGCAGPRSASVAQP